MVLWVNELGSGTFSPGASLMGFTAPSKAGRGFTEKSPFSVAAGVSGKEPGRSDEPACSRGAFSSGTSFANSAVVAEGPTVDITPAVAGVCFLMRSVVRTLFKFPDASFS
jgi:hypothetical protein